MYIHIYTVFGICVSSVSGDWVYIYIYSNYIHILPAMGMLPSGLIIRHCHRSGGQALEGSSQVQPKGNAKFKAKNNVKQQEMT